MSLAGAKLICLNENGQRGEVIEAKGRKFTIGYFMTCDYVLCDARSEGVHCEIQSDAFGRVTIHNKSDKHPISINEHPIIIKRPLLNGTRITILGKHFLWEFPKKCSNEFEDIACSGTSTPQKNIGIPEQPPNSCPDFKFHRDLPKRFTVHNFAYCIQSDDEGNTSLESNADENIVMSSDAQKNLPTICSPIEKLCTDSPSTSADGAVTPERSNTPLIPLEETPKMNLINCTQNKENRSDEKKVKLLSFCKQSDVVITSFSPRQTGVRIEKSFTAIIKPTKSTTTTPKSVYSTPKSVCGEVLDDSSCDFINFSTPATSKKLQARLAKNSSMYLIDFTTPNVLRPASPRHQSALKSVAKKQTEQQPTSKQPISSVTALQLGVSVLPATPRKFEDDRSDTCTPCSSGSVISVDSTKTPTVIEISGEETSPEEPSPTTSGAALKTPGKSNMLSKSAITPKRTPQSLMKRALLTSAKKQITSALARAQNTPEGGLKKSAISPRTPSTSSLLQNRGSLTTPSRRNLTFGKVKADASSNAGASTSFAAKQANRDALPTTSTPKRFSCSFSGLKKGSKTTSPLNRIRKSVGNTVNTSHISKARKSIAQLSNRTAQSVSAQLVAKARKSFCNSPANTRARQMVAAAVATAVTPARDDCEKTNLNMKTENKDLSCPYVVDADDGAEVKAPTDDLSQSAAIEKANDATFSPVKEPKGSKLNITFSPVKEAEQDKSKDTPEEKSTAGTISSVKQETDEKEAILEEEDKKIKPTNKLNVTFSPVKEIDIPIDVTELNIPVIKEDDVSTKMLPTSSAVGSNDVATNTAVLMSSENFADIVVAPPSKAAISNSKNCDIIQQGTKSTAELHQQAIEQSIEVEEIVEIEDSFHAKDDMHLELSSNEATGEEIQVSLIEQEANAGKSNDIPKDADYSAADANVIGESEETAILLEEIDFVLNKSDELKQKHLKEIEDHEDVLKDQSLKIANDIVESMEEVEVKNSNTTKVISELQSLETDVDNITKTPKKMKNERHDPKEKAETEDLPTTSSSSSRKNKDNSDLPTFTPRRSARRASISAGETAPASTPARVTRRRASMTADSTLTPKRISKRRQSMSVDEVIVEVKRAISSPFTPKRISKRRPSISLDVTMEEDERMNTKALTPSKTPSKTKKHILHEIEVNMEAIAEVEDTEVDNILIEDGDETNSAINNLPTQNNTTTTMHKVEEEVEEEIKTHEQENKVMDEILDEVIEENICDIFAEMTATINTDEVCNVQDIVASKSIMQVERDGVEKDNQSDIIAEKNAEHAELVSQKIHVKILDESDYDYGKEMDEDVAATTSRITENKNKVDNSSTPMSASNIIEKIIDVATATLNEKSVREEEANSTMDQVEAVEEIESQQKDVPNELNSTISDGTKIEYTGIREMLATPKGCSTPRFKGLREMMKTPKVCSTPYLGGIKELLDDEAASAANQSDITFETEAEDINPTTTMTLPTLNDTAECEGLDKFFKTPRAKNVMIPNVVPSSATIVQNVDSVELVHSTEYDLNDTNKSDTNQLERIFETPISRRQLDESKIQLDLDDDDDEEAKPTCDVINVEEEEEELQNISAEEAFDKLTGQSSEFHHTPEHKVYSRKSHLSSAASAAASPFSSSDVISDLPKTDIQEWIDNLEDPNTSNVDVFDESLPIELEPSEQEQQQEHEVTMASLLVDNDEKGPLHASRILDSCGKVFLADNNANTTLRSECVINISTVSSKIDPLHESALKVGDTTSKDEPKVERVKTPVDSEISGIDFLDQTGDSGSVFSEPLVVSDTDDSPDDSVQIMHDKARVDNIGNTLTDEGKKIIGDDDDFLVETLDEPKKAKNDDEARGNSNRAEELAKSIVVAVDDTESMQNEDDRHAEDVAASFICNNTNSKSTRTDEELAKSIGVVTDNAEASSLSKENENDDHTEDGTFALNNTKTVDTEDKKLASETTIANTEESILVADDDTKSSSNTCEKTPSKNSAVDDEPQQVIQKMMSSLDDTKRVNTQDATSLNDMVEDPETLETSMENLDQDDQMENLLLNESGDNSMEQVIENSMPPSDDAKDVNKSLINIDEETKTTEEAMLTESVDNSAVKDTTEQEMPFSDVSKNVDKSLNNIDEETKITQEVMLNETAAKDAAEEDMSSSRDTENVNKSLNNKETVLNACSDNSAITHMDKTLNNIDEDIDTIEETAVTESLDQSAVKDATEEVTPSLDNTHNVDKSLNNINEETGIIEEVELNESLGQSAVKDATDEVMPSPDDTKNVDISLNNKETVLNKSLDDNSAATDVTTSLNIIDEEIEIVEETSLNESLDQSAVKDATEEVSPSLDNTHNVDKSLNNINEETGITEEMALNESLGQSAVKDATDQVMPSPDDTKNVDKSLNNKEAVLNESLDDSVVKDVDKSLSNMDEETKTTEQAVLNESIVKDDTAEMIPDMMLSSDVAKKVDNRDTPSSSNILEETNKPEEAIIMESTDMEHVNGVEKSIRNEYAAHSVVKDDTAVIVSQHIMAEFENFQVNPSIAMLQQRSLTPQHVRVRRKSSTRKTMDASEDLNVQIDFKAELAARKRIIEEEDVLEIAEDIDDEGKEMHEQQENVGASNQKCRQTTATPQKDNRLLPHTEEDICYVEDSNEGDTNAVAGNSETSHKSCTSEVVVVESCCDNTLTDSALAAQRTISVVETDDVCIINSSDDEEEKGDTEDVSASSKCAKSKSDATVDSNVKEAIAKNIDTSAVCNNSTHAILTTVSSAAEADEICFVDSSDNDEDNEKAHIRTSAKCDSPIIQSTSTADVSEELVSSPSKNHPTNQPSNDEREVVLIIDASKSIAEMQENDGQSIEMIENQQQMESAQKEIDQGDSSDVVSSSTAEQCTMYHETSHKTHSIPPDTSISVEDDSSTADITTTAAAPAPTEVATVKDSPAISQSGKHPENSVHFKAIIELVDEVVDDVGQEEDKDNYKLKDTTIHIPQSSKTVQNIESITEHTEEDRTTEPDTSSEIGAAVLADVDAKNEEVSNEVSSTELSDIQIVLESTSARRTTRKGSQSSQTSNKSQTTRRGRKKAETKILKQLDEVPIVDEDSNLVVSSQVIVDTAAPVKDSLESSMNIVVAKAEPEKRTRRKASATETTHNVNDNDESSTSRRARRQGEHNKQIIIESEGTAVVDISVVKPKRGGRNVAKVENQSESHKVLEEAQVLEEHKNSSDTIALDDVVTGDIVQENDAEMAKVAAKRRGGRKRKVTDDQQHHDGGARANKEEDNLKSVQEVEMIEEIDSQKVVEGQKQFNVEESREILQNTTKIGSADGEKVTSEEQQLDSDDTDKVEHQEQREAATKRIVGGRRKKMQNNDYLECKTEPESLEATNIEKVLDDHKQFEVEENQKLVLDTEKIEPTESEKDIGQKEVPEKEESQENSQKQAPIKRRGGGRRKKIEHNETEDKIDTETFETTESQTVLDVNYQQELGAEKVEAIETTAHVIEDQQHLDIEKEENSQKEAPAKRRARRKKIEHNDTDEKHDNPEENKDDELKVTRRVGRRARQDVKEEIKEGADDEKDDNKYVHIDSSDLKEEEEKQTNEDNVEEQVFKRRGGRKVEVEETSLATTSKRRVVRSKKQDDKQNDEYSQVVEAVAGEQSINEKDHSVLTSKRGRKRKEHVSEEEPFKDAKNIKLMVESTQAQSEKPTVLNMDSKPKARGRKRRGSHVTADDESDVDEPDIKKATSSPKVIEKTATQPETRVPDSVGPAPRRTRKASTIESHQQSVVEPTTPQRQQPKKRARDTPRRAAASHEHNYDESSDTEAPIDNKRKEVKQHPHMDISVDLSSSATTTSRGRTRKPTARVQQFLEEERAKAGTPRKRLLLSGVADTPASQKLSARRTRKVSVSIETEDVGTTPTVTISTIHEKKRGRARRDAEESVSEQTELTHSEVEDQTEHESSTLAAKATAVKGRGGRGRKAKTVSEDVKSIDVQSSKEPSSEIIQVVENIPTALVTDVVAEEANASETQVKRGGRGRRRPVEEEKGATEDKPTTSHIKSGRGKRGKAAIVVSEKATTDDDDSNDHKVEASVRSYDNDYEEDDEPLAQVVNASAAAAAHGSPAPKRGRRKLNESVSTTDKPATAAGRRRKVVRFEPATDGATGSSTVTANIGDASSKDAVVVASTAIDATAVSEISVKEVSPPPLKRSTRTRRR